MERELPVWFWLALGYVIASKSRRTKPKAPTTAAPPVLSNAAPSAAWVEQHAPITLQKGVLYFARLALGIEALFVSEGTLQEKLEHAGFSNVIVSNDAPAGAPLDAGVVGPFAMGVWQKETKLGDLPAQVKQLWALEIVQIPGAA